MDSAAWTGRWKATPYTGSLGRILGRGAAVAVLAVLFVKVLTGYPA